MVWVIWGDAGLARLGGGAGQSGGVGVASQESSRKCHVHHEFFTRLVVMEAVRPVQGPVVFCLPVQTTAVVWVYTTAVVWLYTTVVAWLLTTAVVWIYTTELQLDSHPSVNTTVQCSESY